MLRRLAFAAAIGVAAVLALACSSGGDGGTADSTAPDSEDLTRGAEAGGVTVEATWLTEATADGADADLSGYPPDEYVLIELTLDTHSGDLNEIDLQREAALKQDGTALEPETWLSLSDDSHHRGGVLVFPRSFEEGEAELTVSIEGEDVALVWETPGTE